MPRDQSAWRQSLEYPQLSVYRWFFLNENSREFWSCCKVMHIKVCLLNVRANPPPQFPPSRLSFIHKLGAVFILIAGFGFSLLLKLNNNNFILSHNLNNVYPRFAHSVFTWTCCFSSDSIAVQASICFCAAKSSPYLKFDCNFARPNGSLSWRSLRSPHFFDSGIVVGPIEIEVNVSLNDSLQLFKKITRGSISLEDWTDWTTSKNIPKTIQISIVPFYRF